MGLDLDRLISRARGRPELPSVGMPAQVRRLVEQARRKPGTPSEKFDGLRTSLESSYVIALRRQVEEAKKLTTPLLDRYSRAVAEHRRNHPDYGWVLDHPGEILAVLMERKPPTQLPSEGFDVGSQRMLGWLQGAEAFAGGGLFDLALTVEGILVREICEIVPEAVETLRLNLHSAATASNAWVWSPTIPKGGLDVLAGGPPCQPFSKGRHLGGEGAGGGRLPMGPRDPRNMYPRVLEWIADAVPRVVVMENSIEITRKKSTVEYFDNWFRQLAHLGYEGTIWGLSSASFGTPQNRERAFVVCWPKGASWGAHLQAPPPPTHADPRSPAVKDGALLPWTRAFDRLNSGCCAGWALTSCVSLGNLEGSCSFCVDGINYEPAPNQSAEEIRADLSAADIASGAKSKSGRAGDPRIKSFPAVPASVARAWVELKSDERRLTSYLAPTVRAGARKSRQGDMIEPDGASPWGDVDRYDPKAVKAYMSQLKRMSIRDAAKLQDVPQWYSFVGSPNQTYMQIGNGIPVNLGRAVARRVVEALRGSTPSFDPIPMARRDAVWGAEITRPYEVMTQGLWPMDRVDPCVGTNLIGYIEGYMYDRPIERVISQQQRRQRPYIEAKAYSEALERREWAEEFGEVWEDRPGSGLYYHHQWDWRPKDSQDAPPGFHDLAYFQQYVQGLDPEVYNHYALLYGWKPWLVAPKQLAEGRRRGRYREARQVAVDGRKVLVHEQSPFAQAPQRRPVAPPEPATVRTPRPARMGTIDLDALIAKALHGRTE